MAKGHNRLTAVEAANLAAGVDKKVADRPDVKRFMFHDGGGLYLAVDRRSRTASWVFRYSVDGKARTMGLGAYHADKTKGVTLAKAREEADKARMHKIDRKDPIEVRRLTETAKKLEAATAMTFKQCAEAYIAAHKKGWRNEKHAAQWPSTLNAYAYPMFGDLPVASVDTGLVMKALEPNWSTKTETMSRLRQRIEAVLDWARVRGYRQGENPARWKGHLDKLLPARAKVAKVEHHAALPFNEIGEFIEALRAQEGTAARGLEFAILTSARTGEVLGAKWGEVDFANRVWTVPADRMKARKEHRVPLSRRAVEILESVKPKEMAPGAVVFANGATGRALSNMAFLMLLRRMGRGELTAHGFRSTFRDWCAEATGFPSEVAEMALAHTVGSKVEAAYRRGDLFERRRALAEAWAAFCAAPAGENVVDLQAAQR